MKDEMVKRFCDFVVARHKIYVNKRDGKPRPWTDDPILQQYRFCNVFRELDAVTEWVHEEWREPNTKDPDVWFAMVVARLFNYPSTLQYLGYPVPFDKKRISGALKDLKKRGEQIFNSAYIVSTNGVAQEKCAYLLDTVLSPLWKKREFYRPREGDTLDSFAGRLQQAVGFKGFMAGQVVADTKYANGHLMNAADWHTWAVSGPGSRRGMNRVVGHDLNASWNETMWLNLVHELQQEVNPKLSKLKYTETLHAQDVQNCLCEFDKYQRVLLGEGRPRSRYPGA